MIAIALAVSVGALAFWSPVDMAGADPGISLLVSHTLLRHGTFNLAEIADDSLVSYDLRRDYRVKPDGQGGYFYYSYGVPLVSLPAVALAEALGMDMRRLEQEVRLQNLLSALVCALVVLLLYRLLSSLTDSAAALVVTAISTLGSPLISTLATGLWNTGYQVVFLLAASILIVRHRPPPILPLTVLVALATICRPTTGFFAVALMVYLLRTSERRVLRWASALGLTGIGLALSWAAFRVSGWLPNYYDPAKLFKTGQALRGAFGLVASPSRGLLVYSPFLIVLLLALSITIRHIWKQPILQLSILWIAMHAVAVAFKATWWGGHAFGPRLLAEIVPALAIITALVWEELLQIQRRQPWAVAYLCSGVVAIAIHSVSGLFNPWTIKWNERPNIDVFPAELFDWHYPQFLATEEKVAQRYLEIQQRTRLPYVVGETLESTSHAAVFEGWSPPEGPWRWSRERLVTIHLDLEVSRPVPFYLLEIKAGAHGRQSAVLRWNQVGIGRLLLDGFEPEEELMVLSGTLVQEGDNRLQIALPGAAPSDDDPRLLGLALHSLRLRPLPPDFDRIDHGDGIFFRSGFGEDESSWRWTDGPVARVSVPIVRAASRKDPALRLHVAALGHQEVDLLWDSVALATLELEGLDPVEKRIPLNPDLLQEGVLHDLQIVIHTPRQAPGDSRSLGLAFISLNLEL